MSLTIELFKSFIDSTDPLGLHLMDQLVGSIHFSLHVLYVYTYIPLFLINTLLMCFDNANGLHVVERADNSHLNAFE